METCLITGCPDEKLSYGAGIAFCLSLIDYSKWQEVALHTKILIFCKEDLNLLVRLYFQSKEKVSILRRSHVVFIVTTICLHSSGLIPQLHCGTALDEFAFPT